MVKDHSSNKNKICISLYISESKRRHTEKSIDSKKKKKKNQQHAVQG